MVKYKFLSHTADVKFQAFGKTLEEAFENSVLAVSETIANGNKIKPKKGKEISVHGTDKENLVYNFIEEIISLLDTDGFVTAKAQVTVLGNNIKAELYGDDAENYQGLNHIKAATYAEMQIKKTDAGWEVQAVVDV